MRRLLYLIVIFFVFGCKNLTRENNPYNSIINNSVLENKIDSILKRMTLVEKIGQMTQITLDVIGKGTSIYDSKLPFEFDEAMLDTVMRKYKVGSILNTPSNTPLTPKEWELIIKRLQDIALEETEIPIIYGLDQIHGTTYTVGGTLFPQQIGMGATFNPSLVKLAAQITAYETKAGSIPWNFSPVLDLGRDARWSRMWETYSEDSYLVAVMGKAYVEGYQGADKEIIGDNNVAACLKHYMGYGTPFSGKDRTPSYISDMDMRERHFAPFLSAVKAGALSVMVNSGLNNGIPIHINYEYLTNWLKRDLNWDGVIVSDWSDIYNIYTRDRIASSKKEAVKLAINAGIDMSMVPYEWSFCTYLKELVEEKEVPISRIDDAVRRILRLKFRLNLFKKPYRKYEDYPDFGSEKHSKVALMASEESITLLKNKDNILPLPKGKRVLVAGPNANNMRSLNGGWTLSWQGEKTDIYAQKYNTILESIITKIGSNNVIYEPGVTYKTGNPPTTSIAYYEENSPEIYKCVEAAKRAEYIILCLGENSYCETPGNLTTMELSVNQQNLALALAATGKPVILVLNEGRPRIISGFEPQMKAIIQTYLPGNYGGDALASIIWGDINPSGKLPYTYPRAANSLITYDYKHSENLNKMQGSYDYDATPFIQWNFGHGLSYTTFKYSNLKCDKQQFSFSDSLSFTIDIKNTGKRAGKETIMLFSSDLYASLTPDNRRLRAFSKISLEPGETKTVKFIVLANDFAFVGADGKWILEKGDFTVQIKDLSLNLTCTNTKRWNEPNIN